MFIISLGGIELNPISAIVLSNPILLIIIGILPILLYFPLKTYKKSYFLTFSIFNSILISYELILIILALN
ncbi:MAG: hypothetical protein ACFFB8_11505 [Promethearchaeota archaeon]